MRSRFAKGIGNYPVLRILDGGMGHSLHRSGVPWNADIWSLAALIDEKYHLNVINAHKAFLQCGCDIITTNSYSCTPLYLSKCDRENELESFIKISVDLAQTAKNEYIEENKMDKNDNITPLIAAGIPPLMESFNINTLLPESQSLYYYNRIIKQLKDTDIDIYLIETMSSFLEAKNVLNAMICNGLQRNSNIKDIYLFFALREDGVLRDGEDFNDMMIKLEEYMDILPIKYIGINCCKPESFDILMNNINTHSLNILNDKNVFIGCYPNAFTDLSRDRVLSRDGAITLRDDITTKVLYNQYFKKWIETYCNDKYRLGLIGGCCGILPNHLQYAVQNLKNDFPDLFVSSIKND